MLTVDADSVDGLASGAWVSVSEIARAKGVSKQAVSKRVDRLVNTGALESRAGPRGQKLINLAEYDRAVGETTDLVRATNGARAAPSADTDAPSGVNANLAREQARRASYDADLKRLDLDERLGKLVPVADVESAMARCAEIFVRNVDQIASRADDIAAAVARDGAAGARALLKTVARELRETIAREMRLTAQEAETGSPPSEDEP